MFRHVDKGGLAEAGGRKVSLELAVGCVANRPRVHHEQHHASFRAQGGAASTYAPSHCRARLRVVLRVVSPRAPRFIFISGGSGPGRVLARVGCKPCAFPRRLFKDSPSLQRKRAKGPLMGQYTLNPAP